MVRPSDSAAKMQETLRASGLKLTPQRLAIVRELADDHTHPTAQELFDRLRPSMPTMSFATVYNTLDALTASGLCSVRSLVPGATRFDPNTEPHHHAVCDECETVFDLPAERTSRADARQVVRQVAPGFVVREVEQIYRGLCAGCAATPRHERASPKSHAPS